tara:strand:+ start:308 stop:439 length:132 start_codon:yes stop_codon:yes gene_type:complete
MVDKKKSAGLVARLKKVFRGNKADKPVHKKLSMKDVIATGLRG